jgi:MoxR-like ATPase
MTKKEFLTKLRNAKGTCVDVFKNEKQKEITILIEEMAGIDTSNLGEADFDLLVKLFDKVLDAEKRGIVIETLADLTEKKQDLEKQEYFNFMDTVRKALKVFNVYLWGDKGNGKSHFAKTLAKETGREIFVQNFAITPLDFQGFKDIQGRYTYSLLELAFLGGKERKGAVLVLEEMDGYNANALIFLNSVLEQGYITTADGEVIHRHPNTTIIACGNTDLLTPSLAYTERNVIDIATADRFLRIKMKNFDYINKQVAGEYYEQINEKIESLHKTKSVRNFVNIRKGLEAGLDIDFLAERLLTD